GFDAHCKPMLLAESAFTAELTAARFDIRLYGALREPSRENPGPPRSIVTPCRTDLSKVGIESPPPPDAMRMTRPYWLSSSGSLARTLRTGPTVGLLVANTASSRVSPPSACST